MAIANANIPLVSFEVKQVIQLSYDILQGVWALVKRSSKKNPPKISFSYTVCIYIQMLSVVLKLFKKRKTGSLKTWKHSSPHITGS